MTWARAYPDVTQVEDVYSDGDAPEVFEDWHKLHPGAYILSFYPLASAVFGHAWRVVYRENNGNR